MESLEDIIAAIAPTVAPSATASTPARGKPTAAAPTAPGPASPQAPGAASVAPLPAPGPPTLPPDAATAFARWVLGTASSPHAGDGRGTGRPRQAASEAPATGGTAVAGPRAAAAGRADAAAPARFTPTTLVGERVAPPVAGRVAEQLATLAGLKAPDPSPPGAAKLQVFADGLPVALAGAAQPLADRAQPLVVALGDGGRDESAAPPRRLVLEVDLPHLGRVRLDGLAEGAHFDLLVAPVPTEVQPSLRALWAMVRARTGLAGELAFPQRAADRT